MRGEKMIGTSARLRVLGFLLLLPSLALWSLWIAAFNLYSTHEQRVAAFLAFVPPFLRDRNALGGVELLTSVASTICFGVSVSKSSGIWRDITIIGLVAAALLVLLNLWQLM
jgi:hypothetical protein